MTDAYQYLVGLIKQSAVKLFSALPVGRTRDNRHKLKYRKLIRKSCFSSCVGDHKHWNKLPS